MRMIPAVFPRESSSAAERKVFRLLSELSAYPEGMAFHSLGLMHHPTKPVSELDFVIGTMDGLLVLEVKGGAIAQHEGAFFSRDRHGVLHSIQDPFTQANTGSHALRRQLDRLLPHLKGEVMVGYAVVLPDTSFDVQSTEWDLDVVIDVRDCRDATSFARALKRVYAFWQERVVRRPMNGRMADDIRQALRPEFERAVSIAGVAGEVELQQLALTEEQYGFIDTLMLNPRVLCTGGAGTGKTFLLAEAARRFAAAGDRILVTCHSPLLAAHLRQILNDSLIEVQPFSCLDELTSAVDVLLVDEAQDIMTLEHLVDVLDGHLRGGIEKGRWVMFYDRNLQAHIHGQFSPEAESLLRDTGATVVPLTRNCRNTREIATWTRVRTGGDIGTAMSGSGLPPRELYWTSPTEQAGMVADILRDCLRDGATPSEIAVLSPVSFGESIFSRLTGPVAVRPWAEARPDQIRFATIDDSKGMESRYVIVGDLQAQPDVTAERVMARLYVAITRARAALWLLIRRDYLAELDQLASDNVQAIKRSTGI